MPISADLLVKQIDSDERRAAERVPVDMRAGFRKQGFDAGLETMIVTTDLLQISLLFRLGLNLPSDQKDGLFGWRSIVHPCSRW